MRRGNEVADRVAVKPAGHALQSGKRNQSPPKSLACGTPHVTTESRELRYPRPLTASENSPPKKLPDSSLLRPSQPAGVDARRGREPSIAVLTASAEDTLVTVEQPSGGIRHGPSSGGHQPFAWAARSWERAHTQPGLIHEVG